MISKLLAESAVKPSTSRRRKAAGSPSPWPVPRRHREIRRRIIRTLTELTDSLASGDPGAWARTARSVRDSLPRSLEIVLAEMLLGQDPEGRDECGGHGLPLLPEAWERFVRLVSVQQTTPNALVFRLAAWCAWTAKEDPQRIKEIAFADAERNQRVLDFDGGSIVGKKPEAYMLARPKNGAGRLLDAALMVALKQVGRHDADNTEESWLLHAVLLDDTLLSEVMAADYTAIMPWAEAEVARLAAEKDARRAAYQREREEQEAAGKSGREMVAEPVRPPTREYDIAMQRAGRHPEYLWEVGHIVSAGLSGHEEALCRLVDVKLDSGNIPVSQILRAAVGDSADVETFYVSEKHWERLERGAATRTATTGTYTTVSDFAGRVLAVCLRRDATELAEKLAVGMAVDTIEAKREYNAKYAVDVPAGSWSSTDAITDELERLGIKIPDAESVVIGALDMPDIVAEAEAGE